MIKQTKKFTPAQILELKSILHARFNAHGTSGIVTVFKNLSVIDVMGGVTSAIKQVGDLGWSIIESGMIESGKALPRAIVKQSQWTREHLGLSKIGAEFSDKSKTAKWVDWVFKHNFLTGIDSIGKEVLINAAYNVAVKKAKSNNPLIFAPFRIELSEIFGERTDDLIKDFQSGKDTRDVRLFLLRKLSDYQPTTLSELPQGFAEGGNWRALYMLKSFDLKKFDVYRRQVFQQIKGKNRKQIAGPLAHEQITDKTGPRVYEGKAKTRLKGIRNLFRIAFYLTAMEATADMLIDLFLGRPVDFSSMFMARLSQLVLSRYTTTRIKREGLGRALLEQAIPPTQAIDSFTKDITSIGDGKGTELIKSVPLVGKVYYWRWGKGSKKIEEQKTENTIRKIQPQRVQANKVKVNRNAIRARRVRPTQ